MGASKKQQDQVRVKWLRLIAEQERSGLSQAEFSRRKGIDPRYFSVWRIKLKGKPIGSVKPAKQESKLNIESTFAPVTMSSTPPAQTQTVRLVLPTGLQCVLPSNLSDEEIKRWVEVLR